MNLALVHDRRLVQSFWEEKISSRTRNEEDEEQRLERSALARWEQPVRTSRSVIHPPSLSLLEEQQKQRDLLLLLLAHRRKHLSLLLLFLSSSPNPSDLFLCTHNPPLSTLVKPEKKLLQQ